MNARTKWKRDTGGIYHLHGTTCVRRVLHVNEELKSSGSSYHWEVRSTDPRAEHLSQFSFKNLVCAKAAVEKCFDLYVYAVMCRTRLHVTVKRTVGALLDRNVKCFASQEEAESYAAVLIMEGATP
jgi:hypothetical protein